MRLKHVGSLVVGALVTFGSAASHADFMVDPNPSGEMFFIGDAYKNVSTFTGNVGGQNSGPTVTVTTVSNVDTGAGFSNIKPVNGGTLTSLVFTPTDPTLFENFSFRGQLVDAGSVTVKVQDNQGDPAQSFTFPGLPKSADFDRIGIIALTGSKETIQSVTLTSDGFKEVKQIEFSQVNPVPEPSSVALAGTFLVIVMGRQCLRLRRRHD